MAITFSDREATILTAISHGLTNKEIGEHLHIAECTVKNYVSRLLNKTGVGSRAELVRAGFQLGILNHEPPPEWNKK